MSKWVIGKYIRLSDADRDLMKKEGKTESESVSHQKALIQNFVNEHEELKGCEQYEFFEKVQVLHDDVKDYMAHVYRGRVPE